MKTNFARLGTRPLRLWPIFVFLACDLFGGHAQAKRAAYRRQARPGPVAAASALRPGAQTPSAAQAVLPAVPRVALLRLNGLGLSEGVRRNLEALVLAHLKQMPHKMIVEPDVVRDVLRDKANAELDTCNEGPVCLVKRGRAVQADVVVYGTISALGNDYSLNLRALQVADGAELGRQVATLSGNLDKLIPQMRLVTFALLAPDAIWGSLMIDTALSGIIVHVDGALQANTPWEQPLDKLAPGAHTVGLDAFGQAHSDIHVSVVPFEITQVQVELSGGATRAIKPVAQTSAQPAASAPLTP